MCGANHQGVVYFCVIGMLMPLCGGCAASLIRYDGGVRVSHDLGFYDLFDNSRDWGPSYLVGPPAHHLGDETRIGDMRTLPPAP
jgi:hypothetical protein